MLKIINMMMISIILGAGGLLCGQINSLSDLKDKKVGEVTTYGDYTRVQELLEEFRIARYNISSLLGNATKKQRSDWEDLIAELDKRMTEGEQKLGAYVAKYGDPEAGEGSTALTNFLSFPGEDRGSLFKKASIWLENSRQEHEGKLLAEFLKKGEKKEACLKRLKALLPPPALDENKGIIKGENLVSALGSTGQLSFMRYAFLINIKAEKTRLILRKFTKIGPEKAAVASVDLSVMQEQVTDSFRVILKK